MDESMVVIFRKTAAIGKTEDVYYLKDEEHYTVSKALILIWQAYRGITEEKAVTEIFDIFHAFHMIGEKFKEAARVLAESLKELGEKVNEYLETETTENFQKDKEVEKPKSRGYPINIRNFNKVIRKDYKPP